MLRRSSELTLSHVGLGVLNEYAAMTLCGDLLSRRLTEGTTNTVFDVTDASGNHLYPGFFSTHLVVPAEHPLDQYSLWREVSVAVEAESFGGMIVDSRFVFCSSGQTLQAAGTFETAGLPYMRSGTLWVVEGSRGRQAVPAIPKRELVAKLPKLVEPPASIGKFEAVQAAGTVDQEFASQFRLPKPLRYELHSGRDIAPGHAVMFSTFVWLQEHAERELLLKHLWPPLETGLLPCLQLRERESYYIDNTYGDRAIEISARARIEPCDADASSPNAKRHIPICQVTFVIEMYEERTGRLLFASKGTKALAVPPDQKALLRSAERVLFQMSSKQREIDVNG